MNLVIALFVALLIGLSLGAVGGGGSILAVPVLVGVLGLSAEEATTSSLVVVGVASLVGVLSHARAGRVAVSAGLGFAAVGVAGSYLGTRLNERLDGDLLLLGFAVLMAVVGTRMLQGLRRTDSLPVDDIPLERLRPDPVAVERSAALPRYSDGARLHRYVSTVTEADPVQTARGREWSPARVALLAATGTVVGFLTGLFGVGGGFVIVPALILVLGFPISIAAATSLLVIAINAAVALMFRSGSIAVDWGIVTPFTAAAIVGVLGGRRIADRVPARQLTAALGIGVIVVGLWTGLDAARNLIAP